MKIAVYGASGYTGRLVLAELRRRKLDVVVCGRNPRRLAAAAGPDAEIRVAATDNAAALRAAFAGCDAVINCAGPFTFHGEPVVRAAIDAGCHYVDTTGEQLYIKRIFDACGEDAQRTGVSVVCAMGFDIVPGDLLAHLTGKRVEPVRTLTLAYGTEGFGMTRGTMHSTLEILKGGDLTYRDGAWVPTGLRAGREAIAYPGEGDVTMMKFPGGEAITIPRHLEVRNVEVVARADALAPRAVAPLVPAISPLLTLLLRTPLRRALDRLVDRLPEGPTEDARRAARFTFVADAVGDDGRRARGTLEGSDIYGITAVTIVEGARRLITDGAPAGVLAPAQAFDAEDFLTFLADHGISWQIDTPDTHRARATA